MNYSRQRKIIIEIMKELKTHPTAEEICDLVQKKDSKISKSTVYRNLNLLKENGIIILIPMSIGPDRYDYIHQQHNHAICIKCGKVVDFEYNFKSDELEESIKKQTGMNSKLDTIIVDGICEDCK